MSLAMISRSHFQTNTAITISLAYPRNPNSLCVSNTMSASEFPVNHTATSSSFVRREEKSSHSPAASSKPVADANQKTSSSKTTSPSYVSVESHEASATPTKTHAAGKNDIKRSHKKKRQGSRLASPLGRLSCSAADDADDLDLMLQHADFPRLLKLVLAVKQSRLELSKLPEQVRKEADASAPHLNRAKGHLLPDEVMQAVTRLQEQLLSSKQKHNSPRLGGDQQNKKPVIARGAYPITDSVIDDALVTLQLEWEHLHRVLAAQMHYSGKKHDDEPVNSSTANIATEGLSSTVGEGNNSRKRKHSKKESIAVKHSKWQTDILMRWMIDHKDEPFPDHDEIKRLMKHTGLSQSQVINWTTNVRKRNRKATCQGGKKPHHFIDFLFLAQDRENQKFKGEQASKPSKRSVKNVGTYRQPPRTKISPMAQPSLAPCSAYPSTAYHFTPSEMNTPETMVQSNTGSSHDQETCNPPMNSSATFQSSYLQESTDYRHQHTPSYQHQTQHYQQCHPMTYSHTDYHQKHPNESRYLSLGHPAPTTAPSAQPMAVTSKPMQSENATLPSAAASDNVSLSTLSSAWEPLDVGTFINGSFLESEEDEDECVLLSEFSEDWLGGQIGNSHNELVKSNDYYHPTFNNHNTASGRNLEASSYEEPAEEFPAMKVISEQGLLESVTDDSSAEPPPTKRVRTMSISMPYLGNGADIQNWAEDMGLAEI